MRVFNASSLALENNFVAFTTEFTGGVNVAVGEGRIVVAAGTGGGPHVKVFNAVTLAEEQSFFAYSTGFSGGVKVAVGEGHIVTGTGPGGGGGQVKVFNAATGAEEQSFLPFPPEYTGGSEVAIGGGRLAVGAGPGGGSHVKIYDTTNWALVGSFFAFAPEFTGGVTVAIGEGKLVVGAASGGSQVKVYDLATLAEIDSLIPAEPTYQAGSRVAITTLAPVTTNTTLVPAGAGFAPAQFFGPGETAYLRREDSPFHGLAFSYFHLEDWEDHALNTPGVSMVAPGYAPTSAINEGLIDSVDADDGLINGFGHDGNGHFGDDAFSGGSFLFTFDATALGALPTHAGIVWTDGFGLVRFEAFDSHGVSLGTTEGVSADSGITGETGEDRFYGVTYGGGISAIRIWSPVGSAMEVDHLQYGRGPALPGGNPMAYAANTGWINARPSINNGLRLNPASLAGRAFGANIGWINFGDGPPAPATTYLNNSASTFGVNRDPIGNLSGYAYSANVGWINFGWASATDPQRARTDLTTGRFLGYAYSANVGWIDLAAAGLAHDVVLFPDTDLDGLPDSWEDAQFGNLASAGPATDYDGDGITDLAEYQSGTDPRDLDSPAPARPSTIATDGGQLYAANAGWIDARPSSRFGLKVGEYFLSGWLSAPNFGWIHVGNGTPRNGHAYANSPATPSDYGVNLDATGALSGHAYGANIGWINFGWAAPNDPKRPRVDLATGLFAGYAYSANLGWIALDSGALRTAMLERLDSDADGMDDAWERENFGSIGTAGVGTDADGDGQSDAAEYIAGTDPNDDADRFRIISQTVADQLSYVTLEFTSSATRRYRIEHTTQLATGVWTDSPLGEFSPDSGARTTRSFSLPSAATARFFRIKAILPLTTPAAP